MNINIGLPNTVIENDLNIKNGYLLEMIERNYGELYKSGEYMFWPHQIFSGKQGRIFDTEKVLFTPDAKFRFFFNPRKRRNIVLEWNYVIWIRILAKFSAKCPSLLERLHRN